MRVRRSVLLLVSVAAVAVPVTTGAFGGAGVAGAALPRALTSASTTTPGPTAGYATLKSNATEAEGTFVLPTFTCTKATQAADFSIQVTSSPNGGSGWVYVNCTAPGVPPTYRGFACATPSPSSPCSSDITPVPGDTITITATTTASQASATVDDVTSNVSTSQTGPGGTQNFGTNFFIGRLAGQIPTFTKVKFTHCTVNGKPISANAPSSLTMVKNNGTTQATPGPLNSAGNGFSVTFVHH
jgi:hypothetical protein